MNQKIKEYYYSELFSIELFLDVCHNGNRYEMNNLSDLMDNLTLKITQTSYLFHFFHALFTINYEIRMNVKVT